MTYHVFHPVVRGIARWGYWFSEATPKGSKRRKVYSRPDTGEPFATRKDVERWIRGLSGVPHDSSAILRQLGDVMFAPGSEWSIRRGRKRGRSLSEQTLRLHRGIYEKYLKPTYGNLPISAIRGRAVEEYLYSLDRSQSSRRAIGQTLSLMLQEAESLRIIDAIPRIELPSKERGAREALTLPELAALFPLDPSARRTVWRLSDHDPLPVCDLAATLCAMMFFGGLRPQEARALHADQVDLDQGVLYVTRQMDTQGRVLPYLKTATAKDSRHRFTYLAERGRQILSWYMEEYHPHGALFLLDGKIVRREFATKRLQKAAPRVGIEPTVVAYSGRYTYETILRGQIDQATLMLLMGHRDPSSPDEYDRPRLEHRARQMLPFADRISRAFRETESP